MTLPILFGANVDPIWQPVDAPVRQARAAEELGLDLVTIQGHPYQSRFYGAWTLLTYLAAQTERVTLVPTVATLPLRPPVVLAKSAASLDLLTGPADGCSWAWVQAPSGTPSPRWEDPVAAPAMPSTRSARRSR
jgi:luciferase-like monooxygenase